jgi:hypothetical protein
MWPVSTGKPVSTAIGPALIVLAPTSKERPMSPATTRPPAAIHHIEARRAFESPEQIERGVLVEVGDEEVTVRVAAGVERLWCPLASELAACLDQAVMLEEGKLVVIGKGGCVLGLPVGPVGATITAGLGILANVAELREGAAVALVTTDPDWWVRLWRIGDRSETGDDGPGGE